MRIALATAAGLATLVLAGPALASAPSAQSVRNNWDTDGNGQISAAEAQAIEAALAANPKRPIGAYDLDGNGKLDETELAALNAKLLAAANAPPKPAKARSGAKPGGQGAKAALPPDPVGTGTATLSWAAPTQNADGSKLKDLAGYVIRYGTAPNRLTHRLEVKDPRQTSAVVDKLGAATWYFAVSAVNKAGVESPAGSLVSKTIQ